MDTVTQTVTIVWNTFDTMPSESGTYLVAFNDGSVETYPISEADLAGTGIRDGRTVGIYWANNIEAPE